MEGREWVGIYLPEGVVVSDGGDYCAEDRIFFV